MLVCFLSGPTCLGLRYAGESSTTLFRRALCRCALCRCPLCGVQATLERHEDFLQGLTTSMQTIDQRLNAQPPAQPPTGAMDFAVQQAGFVSSLALGLGTKVLCEADVACAILSQRVLLAGFAPSSGQGPLSSRRVPQLSRRYALATPCH